MNLILVARGERNDDIEALRALAVILTIVSHVGNLWTWEGRFSGPHTRLPLWGGVDLFFCISGFVIASSLLRQQRADTFAQLAVPFYIRRIFRIWPAALLWLAVPLLCTHVFNTTGAFGHMPSNVTSSAAAVAQVANLYQVLCHSAYVQWSCGRSAEVYWSLSLEEQFYLIFPLMLYFLRPRALCRMLALVILVQLFIPRPVDSPLWFLRTDAISFGVLIALGRCYRPLWVSGTSLVIGRTASAWLALALVVDIGALSSASWLKIHVGLLAIASAGLVLIASDNANVIVPVRALRPFILWVGSRSFAIYLLHNPCYWATREIFQRLYPHATFNDAFLLPFAATALGLMGLCSEATFRLVEAPLRSLGRDLAARWKAKSLAMRTSASPRATRQ